MYVHVKSCYNLPFIAVGIQLFGFVFAKVLKMHTNIIKDKIELEMWCGEMDCTEKSSLVDLEKKIQKFPKGYIISAIKKIWVLLGVNIFRKRECFEQVPSCNKIGMSRSKSRNSSRQRTFSNFTRYFYCFRMIFKKMNFVTRHFAFALAIFFFLSEF